jgi:hypothetical protein
MPTYICLGLEASCEAKFKSHDALDRHCATDGHSHQLYDETGGAYTLEVLKFLGDKPLSEWTEEDVEREYPLNAIN